MKQATVALGGSAAIAALISLVLGKYGLQLSGWSLAALCGTMGVLAAAATAVVLWWRAASSAAKEAPAASSETDINTLIQEASANLRRTKTGLSNRPVIFVIGPRASAKTTSVMNSGIDVEPIAGHVSNGRQIAPTELANLLLMQETIVVDASGSLFEDGKRWTNLVGRFRSGVQNGAGQSARSAVVCVPCDELLNSAETSDRLAQTLRVRLREAAETLGIRMPIYVLFTRTDSIGGFTEYFATLTDDEALGQVLGATFPVRPADASGLHVQQATQKFGDAFDTLFHSVANARVEHLSREHALANRPTIYEFPREFRKIKAAVIRLLVELDRPTQLTQSPFIRGFYFCGLRPVMVAEAAVASPRPEIKQSQHAAGNTGNATEMFRPGDYINRPIDQPAALRRERRVPQWIFLPRVFADVLLRDMTARSVSAASSHFSRRLRILLASGVGTFALVILLWLISFSGNWALLPSPTAVAHTLDANPVMQLASIDELRELDSLRGEVEQLMHYQKDGHPWHLNWGLYAGDEIRPSATRIYFRRFDQLLFGQIQRRTVQRLSSLSPVRREGDEFQPTYEALKAYLVITTEHGRPESDWARDWLKSWLITEWNLTNPGATEEQRMLAERQFMFYASTLRTDNPVPTSPSAEAVRIARSHLLSFSGLDHIYNMLRSRARALAQPVGFQAYFPEAAPFVTNVHIVPGEFTSAGWKSMEKQLRDMTFDAEPWVLGQANLPIQNRAKLRDDIMAAYIRDYVTEWTRYLRATIVKRYQNTTDAASKLRAFSQANTSPLLAALWLASQHTTAPPNVAREFGSVHAMVAPVADGSKNFVTTNSQDYTKILSAFATAVEALALPGSDAPAAAANVTLKKSESLGLISNIAGVLPRGADDAPIKAVGAILVQPVQGFEVPDPAMAAAAEMNGAAKTFCVEWQKVAGKYPFTPQASTEVTRQELAQIFARPEGRLWKLETALKGAIQFNGTRYVSNPASGTRLNSAFMRFFDQIGNFGRALYPTEGLSEPQLKYTLTWEPSEQITSMILTLDGQAVTFSGHTPASKTFEWTGSPTGEAKQEAVLIGGSLPLGHAYAKGPWSVFRFIGSAEKQITQGPRAKLLWIERSGIDGVATQLNGKAITYQFAVEPTVLTREYLAGLHCVSQVTMR
jgi:type VI secretion system protein ImpL